MSLPNPFPNKTDKKDSTKIYKAGKEKFLIEVILDGSSSMSSIQSETIQSFNTFLSKQKEENSDALLSLTIFNTSHEIVYDRNPIEKIQGLDNKKYIPKGMTALNDAIGIRINSVNSYLSNIKKKDRPFVLFCIITDGQENSSRKYNSQQIKTLVEKCQSKGWDFTFLGANIDSFAIGQTYGFQSGKISNFNVTNINQTFESVSAYSTRTRGLVDQGIPVTTSSYLENERKNMVEDKDVS